LEPIHNNQLIGVLETRSPVASINQLHSSIATCTEEMPISHEPSRFIRFVVHCATLFNKEAVWNVVEPSSPFGAPVETWKGGKLRFELL
jgi:hypothetical protein